MCSSYVLLRPWRRSTLCSDLLINLLKHNFFGLKIIWVLNDSSFHLDLLQLLNGYFFAVPHCGHFFEFPIFFQQTSQKFGFDFLINLPKSVLDLRKLRKNLHRDYEFFIDLCKFENFQNFLLNPGSDFWRKLLIGLIEPGVTTLILILSE